MNKKPYTILLFQPYIRSFVTNFGPHLRKCRFIMEHKQEETKQLYKRLTNFSDESNRIKTSWKHWLRRWVGIPAVRFKFTKKADMLLTYGALVITNLPYCIYAETGLALYSYDRGIANNPIARWIVSFLLRRKNCKHIIFLSQAGLKSFIASANYSKRTKEVFKEKATYCYPLMEAQPVSPRIPRKNIRFLFVGTFYIKGGVEIIHAFQKIREEFSTRACLTIITSISVLRQTDKELIEKQDGVTLRNAAFSKEEMRDIYLNHDIFLMPTYRDGFGLVWIEALSFGLPIIGTDQYATREMCINGKTGFLYPNHPLKDYDPKTYEIFGRYYNPKEFYARLFHLQRIGELRDIEDFLYNSMKKFLDTPELLERQSKNSLKFYRERFHQQHIADRIESIFLHSIENTPQEVGE